LDTEKEEAEEEEEEEVREQYVPKHLVRVRVGGERRGPILPAERLAAGLSLGQPVRAHQREKFAGGGLGPLQLFLKNALCRTLEEHTPSTSTYTHIYTHT
jgi:hypothetical protein